MPLFFPDAADPCQDHPDPEAPAQKAALQSETDQYPQAKGHQTVAKHLI